MSEDKELIEKVTERLDNRANSLDRKTLDALAASRRAAMKHAEKNSWFSFFGSWRPVAAAAAFAIVAVVSFQGLFQTGLPKKEPTSMALADQMPVEFLLAEVEEINLAKHDLEFYEWAEEQNM